MPKTHLHLVTLNKVTRSLCYDMHYIWSQKCCVYLLAEAGITVETKDQKNVCITSNFLKRLYKTQT